MHKPMLQKRERKQPEETCHSVTIKHYVNLSKTLESQKPKAVTCCCSVTQSCPTICDPMACSHQAPLSMGFSRQKYWSGFSFPSPEANFCCCC